MAFPFQQMHKYFIGRWDIVPIEDTSIDFSIKLCRGYEYA